MRALPCLLLTVALVHPTHVSASAAGPFPQIHIMNETCESVGAIQTEEELRIVFQNVAQSCALTRCTVIMDEPLDASGVTIEQDGARLPGKFVKTEAACDGHPVWRFDGALPKAGRLLLVGPGTQTSVQIQDMAPPQGPAERAPKGKDALQEQTVPATPDKE
jgi:hypothetical protein